MDIIVTAPVALRATVAYAREHRDMLLQRYSASYVQRAMEVERYAMQEPVLESAVQCEIAEGGIEAALWRLGESVRVGMRVELLQIPILQETVEVFNTLDLDPYRLDAYGSWLLFSENGRETLAGLHRQGFSEAACIGYTVNDRKRILYYGGVERFILPPERYTKSN